MPTADDRLAAIRVKIERAEHHIRDLEREIGVFRQSDPYQVLTEHNPHNGKKSYRFQVRHRPPAIISAIIGDAVHNLRCALDHLIWQLVEANGGKTSIKTAFVIFGEKEKYDAATKDGAEPPTEVKGIAPGAVNVYHSAQPYKGGNDALWTLHHFDRIDKHRLLMVVGFAPTSQTVDFFPGVREALNEFGIEWPALPEPVYEPGYNYPIPEDGAVLDHWDFGFDAETNAKFEFTFEIAFGDPEVRRGHPVLPFLHHLTDVVNSVVSAFSSFL